MKESPCKDCEFRHTYCHANCEVYRDWAVTRRAETEYTTAEKLALNAMWDYSGRYIKK